MTATGETHNPYVGPRAFQRGEDLYGRQREVRELLNLLIAERIVLLYSPSGAGKTSLIQAALMPELVRKKFHILPVMRVSHEPPPGFALPTGANRYSLSLLQSLEDELPDDQQTPLDDLTRLTLGAYLQRRQRQAADWPPETVLIFDQFEEILTVEPTNQAAKQAFFTEVGAALEDRQYWALFVLREDYLASLDPFLRPIPNRFKDTFRLDLLGVPSARQAIQEPARRAGIAFTDAAADSLLDDLCQVQVQQPDGTMAKQPGLAIEPVQLQVVCYRLWEKVLAAQATEISLQDVQTLGDVDSALTDYYVEKVALIAQTTGVHEREIRDWFDQQLITEQGIRGQVLQGVERSAGLANHAIGPLIDAHLVRGEKRRGATWFELAHDRLIAPIRRHNAAWREATLSLLQRQAALWEHEGRAAGLLLRDAALVEAEQWASAHAEAMLVEEREFLEECRSAREAVERERRASRLIRIWAVLATVVMVVAAVLGGFAWMQYRHATAGELAGQALAELESYPARSLHLATYAVSKASTPLGENALRRALLKIPLRLTLQGHTGKISSVNYNFDSTRIVTASDDRTVRIWDAITGQELHQLSHPDAVYYAAFSPNGALILTACRDKTARLWEWEVTPEQAMHAFTGHTHTANLNTAVFRPDGKFVVITRDDHTIWLWDIASGSARDVPDTFTALGSVLSPNGQYVATVGANSTARVQNLLTGEPKEFTVQGEGMAFSPDSQQLVTLQLYDAMQWDIASGAMSARYTGHTWYLSSVAFSGDGQLLLTGAESARLWDAERGTQLEILRGHQGSVTSVAFSPDGQWIVTASTDNTVRIFDLAVWRQYTLIGQTGRVNSAVYNHDGTQIATANNYYEADHPHVIKIWDVKTGRQLKSFQGHKGLIGKIAYRPDGQRLVSASDDGTARVWDVASGEELDPDKRISSTAIIHAAVYNPDGTKIITAGRDDRAHIWDATTRKELVKPLQEHTSGLLGAEFSRDGQKVVTASFDYTARIWDATTGERVRVLQGHENLVTSARFSRDGRLVVTASVDGTARVWNVAAEAEPIVWILAGHTAEVTDAVFSPDARFIATASRDHTARLWDVATGNGVITLYGHTRDVTTVAYSPDGKRLITASDDGTVRIHLIQPEERLALARTWLKRHLTCQESGYSLPEQRDWLAYLLRADPACGQKTR